MLLALRRQMFDRLRISCRKEQLVDYSPLLHRCRTAPIDLLSISVVIIVKSCIALCTTVTYPTRGLKKFLD